MADELPTPRPSWPVLDPLQRRVLGVLVEKAKTTPDAYPLTMNALVSGCNQKSNRDPVMDLDEGQIDDTLQTLRQLGLVVIVMGTRVDRWRHQLYEVWTSDKVQMAVLTELLLRGPQTEGELRTRVSRMEPIEDIDHLRAVIQPLVDRELVLYLTPPGRRGSTLTHGFHSPEEITRLRSTHGSSSFVDEAPPLPRPVPTAPAPVSHAPDRFAVLEAKLAAACEEIAHLKGVQLQTREELTLLRGLLEQLRSELGIGAVPELPRVIPTPT